MRLFSGQDIRELGSHNIGATNVGRVLGKKWAIITAIIDISKGGIAVLCAYVFGCNPLTIAITGVSSVIGHNYTVWLRFHGGKGVATSLGVIACYDFFNPWPFLCGAFVWIIVMKLTQFASLASLFSLITITVFMFFTDVPLPFSLATLTLTILSIWRHRSNIQRLILGNENKV